MARLVTIGDSLTQGFQSGAISKTDWSYPAIIARTLGLTLGSDFRIPTFPDDGLPINIEEMLRMVAAKLGNDISFVEFVVRFIPLVRQYVNRIEDIYERGVGVAPAASDAVHHNLAVWGFQVADCWNITSEYVQYAIDTQEGLFANDIAEPPSAAMYRTARRVLNPALRQDRMRWNVLDNLKHIVDTENGLDNLIIWLGPNECLGTVVELDVRLMEQTNVTTDPMRRRESFNLTHPEVFRREFADLLNRIAALIPATTRVFVGNVPHVTIPPVTRGIPPRFGDYYQYYGRFFATDSQFNPLLHKHLTMHDAVLIDHAIDSYNRTIASEVTARGANWHLVDLCAILDTLAVKRNNAQDDPGRRLRQYYTDLGQPNHPLLNLRPVPSILSLRIDQAGKRTQGGLISLDGVHPSTIGYGIVAEAFLQAMHTAGEMNADPQRLKWADIIAADTQLQQPPRVWDDVFAASEQHITLWDWVFRQIRW